ncbi:hypothetical protein FQN53_008280 [Emmonsiellopsis sp. PD_33]|nr:hypothetical protein FQN53_008280 [Emmonsiellopsis sp. PD_33]
MKLFILLAAALLAIVSTADAWDIHFKGFKGKKLNAHGFDFTRGKCIDLKKSYNTKTRSVKWNLATDWLSDPNTIIFYEKAGCEWSVGKSSKKKKTWTPKEPVKIRSYKLV